LKTRKFAVVFIALFMISVLSGCQFRNEYTYKDIAFTVNKKYESLLTDEGYAFKTDDAEIVVKQSESKLRRLVNDKAYIDEYDVEYKIDSANINDVYYAVTYMERSELKGGTVRFKSIEYSFNVSGKNYIVIIEDLIDVIDIKPHEEELERIIDSMDMSWNS